MAVINNVKLSKLEGQKRIDAEYYQQEYFNLLKDLSRVGTTSVKHVAIPNRRKFKAREGEYFDYIEIAEVDLTTGQFEVSRISGENAPDRAQWTVRKGDILISTVRPIRNAVVLVREDQKNLVCSSGFCVLSPKNISSSYLFVYFKVGFIAYLLDRYTTATEYPAVTWDDVLKIPVYLGNKSFQNQISKIVEESYKLLYESKTFYHQAEHLLLEELGLKDFKPKYELSYTANLSNAFCVHRVDAEYFQPAYSKIEEHLIKKFSAKPIKQLNYIEVTTGQYSEKYIDKSEGMPYIRGTDLKNGTINIDDLVYISPEDQIETKKAKEGDVVVTRVGTIGLSARIPKECEGGTISDNLIRLRFGQQKLNSYYLTLFLGSPLGVSLMIRNSRGSVQQRLNQETLKEVFIPLLPLEIQQKISSLVQQSHEARKKAKELLEIAKKSVEIAIEKNEKEALNYISKF